VQQIWVEMAKAISENERVCLTVGDERAELEATKRLTEAGAVIEHVSLYRIPTVDVWIRDYGPTFVTRKGREHKLAFNDWIYNAWGRKYESFIQDDGVAKEIARLLPVPVFAPEIVLEGGSIEVNGYGTCLTTEQCLLNPNRNPHLGRKEIETILRDYLGVDQRRYSPGDLERAFSHSQGSWNSVPSSRGGARSNTLRHATGTALIRR
jgi:agmatine deiminase